MNKQELEAYLRQLCKDKQYDAEKTERVVAKGLARADDEDEALLNAALEAPIKGSADYNRKVDELKAKATTLDNWHKQAEATVAENARQAKEAQAKVEAFEKRFGPLEDVQVDDHGQARGKGGKAIDDGTLREILLARDRYFIEQQAELGDIRSNHARMFKGEIISDREILNEMGKMEAALPEDERGKVRPQHAYERLYGDRVKKLNEDQVKANEQRLRDEGAKQERERLARQGMRTGATAGETGIAFDALNRKQDDARNKLTDEDRLTEFAADMEAEFAKQDARYNAVATEA